MLIDLTITIEVEEEEMSKDNPALVAILSDMEDMVYHTTDFSVYATSIT